MAYEPKSHNTLCLYQNDVNMIREHEFSLDDMVTITVTGRIKRLDNDNEEYYEPVGTKGEKEKKRQRVQIELKDISKVSIMDSKQKGSKDELNDSMEEYGMEEKEDEE